MIPFFFGSSAHALFGIHHAPARGARDAGVVLLPPIGQEAIRAHRALKQLAIALTQARYHVLRFDYRGTGDSAGEFEEARFSTWTEDITTASDELKDRTGIQRVSWVGLRMGGALGLAAAKGRRDIDKLVLWEPIVHGAPYLRELRRLHEDFLRQELPKRQHYAPAADELLGFPMPAPLRAEIEALDITAAAAPSARALHAIVSKESTEEAALQAALPRLHANATFRYVALEKDWNSEEAVNSSLVPAPAIDAIVQLFGER